MRFEEPGRPESKHRRSSVTAGSSGREVEPEPEDAEALEAFDAVRLFLRAAQRIGTASVGTLDAPAIIDICRQVEGLPLALELAASWTRVLTCDEIAAELRQGTELLRATDTTKPARHASMDVVFDQSWRLLSDVERAALPRLTALRSPRIRRRTR